MSDCAERLMLQKSHALACAVYRASADIPRDKYDRLINQMRRASVAVAALIVRGYARGGNLRPHLRGALRIADDLAYQLLLARDLDLLTTPAYQQLQRELAQLRRELIAWRQRLPAQRSEPGIIASNIV